MGCWAHARRKFVKVVKVRKKHRSKRANPKSLADEALEYIGKLYQVEKEARQRDLNRKCDLLSSPREIQAVFEQVQNVVDHPPAVNTTQGAIGPSDQLYAIQLGKVDHLS